MCAASQAARRQSIFSSAAQSKPVRKIPKRMTYQMASAKFQVNTSMIRVLVMYRCMKKIVTRPT